MQIIKMTPAEWSKVPDNPIQRNTEEHAKKALRGHLSAASQTHSIVAAARLPGGLLIKLDGHTRSALWSDGRLAAPDAVSVVVYDVKSIDGAVGLYKQFDNPGAAENAGDRLNGAYRLHGINPLSKLLTHGGITSALAIIEPNRPIYDSVGDWRPELMALDSMDVSPGAMPSTLICAALATTRKRGAAALDFWRLFAAGGGTRIDGKSCGVDALSRMVADLRARKHLATGGGAMRLAQAERAISCCESWLSGRLYSTGVKPTDLKAYLHGTKRSAATKRPASRTERAALMEPA